MTGQIAKTENAKEAQRAFAGKLTTVFLGRCTLVAAAAH